MGKYLEHRAPDDLACNQPCHPLKSGVDVEKAVVDGLAPVVADDLMQGKGIEHLPEERSVAFF